MCCRNHDEGKKILEKYWYKRTNKTTTTHNHKLLKSHPGHVEYALGGLITTLWSPKHWFTMNRINIV